MLLQNKRIIYQTPWHLDWWALFNTTNSFKKNTKGVYSWVTYSNKSGLPLWTEGFYSYSLAIKWWWLASYSTNWVGNASMNLLKWLSISGTINWVWNITWNLALIIQLLGTINWVWVLTWSMVWSIALSWTLAWLGNITWTLSAIIDILWEALWQGTLTWDIKGKWSLSWNITPFTELSAEWLASAVWNSTASAYTDNTTMWWKINTLATWWIDISEVWNYPTRTLTESAWLTTEQDAQLQQIYNRVDTKVSYVSYGNWWWFNYEDLQKKLTELKEELKEDINDKKIDFTEILTKIEDIEIPEVIWQREIKEITEKEMKPILKKIELIEKYVEKKNKQEENEKIIERDLKVMKKELLKEMETQNKELQELRDTILQELELNEIYNIIKD